MVHQVALNLPADKAKALVAAAGLGHDVLEENAAVEAKLQQLRLRRAEQNLQVKSTTSGATTRDVQLVACRLANRLCLTLDDNDADTNEGLSRGGNALSVAVAIATSGGIAAVALLFRMFDASDLDLMVEALTFALEMARGCTRGSSSDDVSETSSLASRTQSVELEVRRREVTETCALLPLLQALHAPSVCRRMTEAAKEFPRSRRIQRLCCLLVAELGGTCGAPARRCFAECCEPIVAAAAGGLDEHAASDSDEASSFRGGGDSSTRQSTSSSGRLGNRGRVDGVREAACIALSKLAQEPGLACRLATAGAGHALTHAMKAAPRERELQLSCLECIELLATSTSGMWIEAAEGNGEGPISTPPAIEVACRKVVESVQTFVRDAMVHRAASRAVLALIEGDASHNAAHHLGVAGAATALSRVLATSPNDYDVQLPAVLAIAALLEGCEVEIAGHESSPRKSSALPSDQEMEAGVVTLMDLPTLVSELVSAAGCELLCKSAKTFPRDRDLRLGCLRAMSALCRGAGSIAVQRLVDGGACEQVGERLHFRRCYEHERILRRHMHRVSKLVTHLCAQR